MAFKYINGCLWIPTIGSHSGAAPALIDSALLDATAEKAAWVFMVPKTGVLDQFEFRLGTVTQAPANGLKCSFQDVDPATGYPDGTADQYRTVTAGLTANTWVAPGLITSDGTDQGTKRSVTRGQILCAVIGFTSFSTGDSLQISGMDFVSTGQLLTNFPYCFQYTTYWGGGVDRYCFALKYDDGTYEFVSPEILPVNAINSSSVASNTDPKEIGIYFTVPFPCKISGCWFRADLDGNTDIVLYDSDGTTELASVTLDKDNRYSLNGGNHFIIFPSDVSLAKDTYYRLVFQPTTTTAITVYDLQVPSAAHMDGLELGQECHMTTKSAADAWSQTTTKRPMIGLCLSGFDDAVADYPDVGNVTEDDTVNGVTGTYHEATVAEVQSGVQFGASSSLTGTYAGGGGGLLINPGLSGGLR